MLDYKIKKTQCNILTKLKTFDQVSSLKSKKITNDQELIQSYLISCKGND